MRTIIIGDVHGCVSYEYRNLPYTVGRWYVAGQDRRDGGGGILEWCASKEDAHQVLEQMRQDTGRFARLGVGFDSEYHPRKGGGE